MKLHWVFLFCLSATGVVHAMKEKEKETEKKPELQYHVSELFTTPESLERFGLTLSGMAQNESDQIQKIRLLETAVIKLEKAAEGYAQREDSPSARRLRSGSIMDLQYLVKQLSVSAIKKPLNGTESMKRAEEYVQAGVSAWEKGQRLEKACLAKGKKKKKRKKSKSVRSKSVREEDDNKLEKSVVDAYITAYMIFCEAVVEFCNAFLGNGDKKARGKAITMIQRAHHLEVWLDIHGFYDSLLIKSKCEQSKDTISTEQSDENNKNMEDWCFIDTAWEILEKCDGLDKNEKDIKKVNTKRGEFLGLLAKIRFNHAKNVACCSESFKRHLYTETTMLAQKAAEYYIAINSTDQAEEIMTEVVQPIDRWLLELNRLQCSVSNRSGDIWASIRKSKIQKPRDIEKISARSLFRESQKAQETPNVKKYRQALKKFEDVQIRHTRAKKPTDFEGVEKAYLEIIHSCIAVYAENADPVAIEHAKRILLLVKEIEDWKLKNNIKNDDNTKQYFGYQVVLIHKDKMMESSDMVRGHLSESSSSGSSDENVSEIITAPNMKLTKSALQLLEKGKEAHLKAKQAWGQTSTKSNPFTRKKREKENLENCQIAERKGLLAARYFMNMYNAEGVGADWCLSSWKIARKAGKKLNKTKKYRPPQGNSDLVAFVSKQKKLKKEKS